MSNIKLPCGINENNENVYIENAKNGFACKCVCPGCKQPLIAKNAGKIREHHFAHFSSVECEHGYQTALHYMAKDLFLEMKSFVFLKDGKPVYYKIDSVQLEKAVSDIIPDILIVSDGKLFIVEIFVTHAVDDVKKQKINNLKISALEINISRFKNKFIDKETLKQELCDINNFSWIYDSDVELINQKKKIICQFGIKIPIQIANAIACPILARQEDRFARFVTLEFCYHCANCVYQKGQKFISCARILPIPLSIEMRKKIYAHVFVNDNKVMLASEFKKYNEEFFKNLELAMQRQYRRFTSLTSTSYSAPIYANLIPQQQSYRKSHYYWNRKKKHR